MSFDKVSFRRGIHLALICLIPVVAILLVSSAVQASWHDGVDFTTGFLFDIGTLGFLSGIVFSIVSLPFPNKETALGVNLVIGASFLTLVWLGSVWLEAIHLLPCIACGEGMSFWIMSKAEAKFHQEQACHRGYPSFREKPKNLNEAVKELLDFGSDW